MLTASKCDDILNKSLGCDRKTTKVVKENGL